MTATVPTTMVRGDSLVVSFTPVDQNGDPTNPATGVLNIIYYLSGLAQSTTAALTNSAGVWSGTWDTSQAGAGPLICSAVFTSPGGRFDFTIILTANAANPDP